MSAHISEELPRLLTGDATRDETVDAAAHLRGCPDCQQELVSAVVAHASLASAHRFAPEIVGREAPAREPAPMTPLPDLSAMFAQVRQEASPEVAKPKRTGRLLAVAAAALVLAGGGITIAQTTGSSSSPAPSRSIALGAYGTGSVPAKVTIVDNKTMKVDATALPKLDSQHFYELWLTNAARDHMQSLGAIGNDNRAQLTVSPKVMSNYSDIEVSVQRTNQPAYSGTSVLRGSYS
jgi:Anti-sigma-K factor rskA